MVSRSFILTISNLVAERVDVVFHTLQHLALDTDTLIRNALDGVWVRVARKEVLALQRLKKVDKAKYKTAKRAMQLKSEEEADRCCAVMDETGKVKMVSLLLSYDYDTTVSTL